MIQDCIYTIYTYWPWLEYIVYICNDIIKHEETERKQWGNNAYYMRHWLRLLTAQPIVESS